MSLNICKYDGQIIFGNNNIICCDKNLWDVLYDSYNKNLSLRDIIDSIRNKYKSELEPDNYFVYFNLLEEIKYVHELSYIGKSGYFNPETRKFYSEKTIGSSLSPDKTTDLFDSRILDCFNPVTESIELSMTIKRPVQIFIKVFGCRSTITLHDVYLDYKVYKLKEMIRDKSGIPVDTQRRLIFEGRQLDDANILVYYGVNRESTIYLTLPLKGGMHAHSSGHNDYNANEILKNVQIKYKKGEMINSMMVPWTIEDDADSFTKKVELLIDNI